MAKTIATPNKMPTINIKRVPSNEMDSLARATLRAVERYFSLPGVQEAYEKWLEEDYNQREHIKN